MGLNGLPPALRGRGELVFAALLTLAGLAIVIQGFRYGVWTDRGRIGPGASPVLWGSVLAAAGLRIVIATGWRRAADEAEPAPAPSQVAEAAAADGLPAGPPATDGRRIVTLFGMLAVTAFLGSRIGLLWASMIFVFVVTAFVERLKLRTALVLTGITGLLIWSIFVHLLDLDI